ncbi:CCA tRNA nucleotidyltransferase [Chryseomicrobium palamuruense]|uniref:CCA tRNA nucleotidyltransferase n=1 Tax=Chryseomicrobium palamuruense TaxID=682973 RepID=A0ABV8UU45_9BACL
MKSRWPAAFQVIDALERQGFEAVVVGGAVRDYLLDKRVKDYDVATSATPEEVKRVFTRTIDTGIAHGTVTVLMGQPVEVTTFRVETEYTDFRRPDTVQFVRNLKDDLARRDFTINAMALTKEDQLIDYYGGKVDLEQNVIRAVGEAEKRFSEDALRILRGIRFTSQLGFCIENQTDIAMKQCAALLTHIAKERVKQELDRIWTSANPEKALRYLRQEELNKALPGDWQVLPSLTKGFLTASLGWAWYHAFQPSRIDLPFSNVEKKLIQETNEVIERIHTYGWTYEAVFGFSKESVLVSHVVFSEASPFYTDEEVESWLTKAPLRSLIDLSVSGRELIEWSAAKQGPWIRTLQQQIAQQILQGHLENTQPAIKDWMKKNDTETTNFRNS